MSKMDNYITTGTGLTASGTPASMIQFVFGEAPFMPPETADLEDVVDVHAICHSEAIADIRFMDDVAMVSFDFTQEPGILNNLFSKLEDYKHKKDQIQEHLQKLVFQYDMAIENADDEEAATLQEALETIKVPFVAVYLFPVQYDNTVQISFDDDPKFVFYTSNQLDQNPSRVTMIYDAHDVYCQDESAVYHLDDDDYEDDDENDL